MRPSCARRRGEQYPAEGDLLPQHRAERDADEHLVGELAAVEAGDPGVGEQRAEAEDGEGNRIAACDQGKEAPPQLSPAGSRRRPSPRSSHDSRLTRAAARSAPAAATLATT